MDTASTRKFALGTLLLLTLVGLLYYLPPVTQNPIYHAFADARTLHEIPNFWNVVSNLPFVLIAAYGLKALRSPAAFLHPWERLAYAILLFGTAAIAAGSAYYHWHPTDERLFWDRLPM